MNSQLAGFSAQNVQASIPEAVGTSTTGYMTFSDRPVLAAVVNAIKEIANIAGLFRANLIAWLASTTNGITDVHAQRLCAGSVCVNESQLAALLAGQSASGPSAPPPPPAPTSTTTLILNGNNPTEWTLNTPWTDGIGALFAHGANIETIYSTTTVDTTVSGTSTIDYWAQVPGSQWLHATRTVIIEAP